MPQNPRISLDDLPDSDSSSDISNRGRGINLDSLPDQDHQEQPEQRGFISRAWHAVSDPLTDIPSRIGQSASDYMTDPSRAIVSPTGQGGLHDVAAKVLAYGQGFMGGAAEGVGNLASSMTSPLNLATLAATGGSSALTNAAPNAARLLNIGGRILSAPVAAHGAIEMLRPDATMRERAMGLAETAGGVAGMMHVPSAKSRTPTIEEIINERPIDPGQMHGPDLPRTDIDFMSRKTPINPEILQEGGFGNTDAAMASTGMDEGRLNSGAVRGKTANEMFGEMRSDIRRNSADALRNEIDYSDIENTSPDVLINGKPSVSESSIESSPKNIDLEDLPHHEAPVEPTTKGRYKLDRQSGAFIPIDEAGNQIGPAVSEKGEPVRPDLAYQSKYNKQSIPGGPETTPNEMFPEAPPSNAKQSELFGSTGASGPGGPFDPPTGGGDIPGGPDPNAKQPNMFGEPPVVADKGSKLQQAYDLSRSLMSVDPPFVTSAAFRQASPLIGTKAWRGSWVKAAKAYGSEATYNAIMDSIKEQPLFKAMGGLPSYAEQAGLRLGDLTSYLKREEFVKSELAEKIPIYGKAVRASNRAYTAYLNSARADTFSNMIQDLEKLGYNPKTDLTLGKAVADYVNTATGTGKLALGAGNHEINLERNAKLLSNVFFSPRKMASELQMLNPANYVMGNPYIRKQYLASMVRRVGTWWTMAGLAGLAGAKVSTNPTNPDFGKIRIGNTRIDPPGGLQQYLVLGSQIAKGGKTSSTSGQFNQFGKGYKPETTGSTMMGFAANRLHPTAKAAWDIATANKNNEFHLGDRAIQAVVPMFMDDLMSVVKDNPELAPLVLGAAGTGMGTQTYDKGSFGKPTYLPQKYDVNFGR